MSAEPTNRVIHMREDVRQVLHELLTARSEARANRRVKFPPVVVTLEPGWELEFSENLLKKVPGFSDYIVAIFWGTGSILVNGKMFGNLYIRARHFKPYVPSAPEGSPLVLEFDPAKTFPLPYFPLFGDRAISL